MTPLEEYQNIEIIIELDKGHGVNAVAEQFGVSSHYIRRVAAIAGLGAFAKKKMLRKKRLSDEDHDCILNRIMDGEAIESLAHEFDVSASTILQWCKKESVVAPRSLRHLSKKECSEIRELLAANESPNEIATAYNLSLTAVEQLLENDYKQLDPEALGFLYETLLENPGATLSAIKRLVQKAGFELNESMILSYQFRLGQLERIDRENAE